MLIHAQSNNPLSIYIWWQHLWNKRIGTNGKGFHISLCQTYVSEYGHDYSAPYWMGEFGTGDDDKNWNKIGTQGWEN